MTRLPRVAVAVATAPAKLTQPQLRALPAWHTEVPFPDHRKSEICMVTILERAGLFAMMAMSMLSVYLIGPKLGAYGSGISIALISIILITWNYLDTKIRKSSSVGEAERLINRIEDAAED